MAALTLAQGRVRVAGRSVTTTPDLQMRLPLTRLSRGRYVTADRSVVIEKECEQTWIVRGARGPIRVFGRRDFQALTEAHGLLADARVPVL
jgi:hypothetical protein